MCTNKHVVKRYGRGNDPQCAQLLATNLCALWVDVTMCVKGLETGDVVVTYRSVLSKSFLESASWKGVLEQTWAETETGCLLSSDFNEAIFVQKVD